ncbi:LOW QUALITY PROTEIN: hypothetical protein NC653_018515 [Populus alba x Populus x berolinensis]|uniref:Uncharacterized protein n=1 Tax=Populus alba x Populus x berolinensis TaxID=444605 RepID=A0AAD6VVG6_9ROSI|nr:LOW QUALITY PROTEIN: hypothetical protein NC653_018515 [Populus alba x Populus x berolinensis]
MKQTLIIIGCVRGNKILLQGLMSLNLLGLDIKHACHIILQGTLFLTFLAFVSHNMSCNFSSRTSEKFKGPE